MAKILVIADPIDQKPLALKRASELAGKLGTGIHVVFFCYENLRSIKNASEIKAKVIEAVAKKAQLLLHKHVEKNVKLSSEVVWEKHIPGWIVKHTSSTKYTLVIKTGHRSETMFYTPTDWHLVRTCPLPMMISAQQKLKKASTVMAAVDLETKSREKMSLNRKVLKYASNLANKLNADLHVVYTPPVSPVLQDLGIQFSDEKENIAVKKLQKNVESLSQQYKIPKKNIHIKAGQPEKVIPSVASKNKSELIVLGTVGRKKLTGKLVGNTAEGILRLSRSDVIVLKP